MIIKRLKDRLRNTLNVSVSEIGNQDESRCEAELDLYEVNEELASPGTSAPVSSEFRSYDIPMELLRTLSELGLSTVGPDHDRIQSVRVGQSPASRTLGFAAKPPLFRGVSRKSTADKVTHGLASVAFAARDFEGFRVY